jgi:ribonuclease HII
MTLLIGIDEAGYGPNLGPLVIAASAWEVEETIAESGKRKTEERAVLIDLYQRLADTVSRTPAEGRIAIGDSKRLYQPGGGLGRLERAVHPALLVSRQAGDSWSALLETLGADAQGRRQELPWQHSFDCPLPGDVAADEVNRLGKRLDETCRAASARPIGLRGRLVFPRQFNELTTQHDSKGAALSQTTLELLRDMLDKIARKQDRPLPPTSTTIVCDKHGGRNRYGPLLAAHFPAETIRTLAESRAESCYEWGTPESPVEICFRARGEAFMPTALASMTAKYLRELAMNCFNRYWQTHVSGIRPTAGYPLDAKRFLTEIHVVQRRLGIPDHDLWRNR